MTAPEAQSVELPAPRTRYTVHLTTSVDPITIYADDWHTDGDHGAQFVAGDHVVAAIRSGYLVAIIAEQAERARG